MSNFLYKPTKSEELRFLSTKARPIYKTMFHLAMMPVYLTAIFILFNGGL